MNSNCYLCGCEITEKNKSIEHIIPEALGGKLTSSSILCVDCNSKLGQEVDAPFVKTIEPIIATLDIVGRENTKFTIECDIILEDGTVIKGILNGDKLQPKQPMHQREGNKVRFYGSNKTYKTYSKKIFEEAKKDGFTENSLDIKKIDDIRGMFRTKFEINNENFQQSLTKIALNFAIDKGIDSDLFKHLIDKTNKRIKKGINVSYIPCTKFEAVIERVRPHIDMNYPNHSIVLFSEKMSENKTYLVCFIELFSTFQQFIILSTNYVGEPIFEDYWQKTLKEGVIDYEVTGSLNHKSILPELYAFQSRRPDMDLQKIGKDKNVDERDKQIKRIMETYLSQPNYVEKYESHLEQLFNAISMPLMISIDPIKGESLAKFTKPEIIKLLSEYETQFLESAMMEMGQLYFTFTEEQPDIVLKEHFRRIFTENKSVGNIFYKLTPKFISENWKLFQKYGAEKFNDLSKFKNDLFLEKKDKYYKNKELKKEK